MYIYTYVYICMCTYAHIYMYKIGAVLPDWGRVEDGQSQDQEFKTSLDYILSSKPAWAA